MAVIRIRDRFFEPYILSDEIRNRVSEMSRQISADYEGKNPLLLVVLNGAFIFAADLFREISIPCEVAFVKLASYEGTMSTGLVKQEIVFPEHMENRHVIVVEDIVDTGLTMKYTLEYLMQEGPSSIKIATLLLKKGALKFPVHAAYTGFEIPDRFVIGYGLDYNGTARNLPHLFIEHGSV